VTLAADTSALVTIGNFLFRYRKFVLVPALLVLCAIFPPILARHDARLDAWFNRLGLGIAFAGQILRAAVIGYAYIKRGGLSGKVYAAGLVSQGLFAHSRNPLYLGNLLILCGLMIVHNNPWVYLIGLPLAILVYSAIVAAEESYLRARFGEEYGDYCRQVNRWLPNLRGLGRTLAGMRFNWRRLVVKEYGTAYAWLTAALILLAREAVLFSGDGRMRLRLEELGLLLILCTAGWATARTLKKKRLLTQHAPARPGHNISTP